jgi:Rrf2 family protein
MKLSTKGRYGTRLMLELALHESSELVTLHQISKQQKISKKYLWSLINPLHRAGLVRAIRGAQGGYALAKPPAEITLRDIIVEVEGPLSIVDCVQMPSICDREPLCIARDVWMELSGKIEETLASVTLKDLVDRYQKKQQCPPHEKATKSSTGALE